MNFSSFFLNLTQKQDTADTDLCEQTDQPLLGSERISSYPQFTDDCSKCKDIKYHTSTTDHDTAMRQLYRGPPFRRKCVDCNSTIFDTSQREWKYRLDETVRFCNYCSAKIKDKRIKHIIISRV